MVGCKICGGKCQYKSKEVVYNGGQTHDFNMRGKATPIFDTSDYLHFACRDCRIVLDILCMRLRSDTFHIYFECPNCSKVSKRKIYIKDKNTYHMRFPVYMDGTEMTKTPREIIRDIKTNPKQTICDEAERLWAVYLKTQNEQDHQNYENHVLSHDEDFEDLKKLKEYREGLESE